MPNEPNAVPEPERYPYPFTRSPIPWWLISIVFLTLLATAAFWGSLALGAAVLECATHDAADRSGVPRPR
jgi:hypothetical protein